MATRRSELCGNQNPRPFKWIQIQLRAKTPKWYLFSIAFYDPLKSISVNVGYTKVVALEILNKQKCPQKGKKVASTWRKMHLKSKVLVGTKIFSNLFKPIHFLGKHAALLRFKSIFGKHSSSFVANQFSQISSNSSNFSRKFSS